MTPGYITDDVPQYIRKIDLSTKTRLEMISL